MKNDVLEVIIVGAGPAGLCASYFLKNKGVEHVVFERGKIGESWRSQRWHTFRLNSPNRLNELLGGNYFSNDQEGFCSSPEFVASLEEYVSTSQLPVLENTKVQSIEKPEGAEDFRVEVLQDGSMRTYYSRQVIIASGGQNEVKLPDFAKHISSEITQLHASTYRHPGQLAEGNVLVVGSAQSGCQIAEDLADAGRKVYLSTSMVARAPRKYRGRDIHDWLLEMKFFDVRAEEITDPKMLQMRAPQITGVAQDKRTVSLQWLAKKGVVVLGKLENAVGNHLSFQSNAAMHVKFADEFSKKVKDMIDEFIAKNQLPDDQVTEIDEADIPDDTASCASSITALDMLEHNIKSVVWATGFANNLSYIKLPVLNAEGNPKHHEGISDIQGLYFLGFPLLRTRKSILLCGIKEDAEFIGEKVYANSTLKEVV